MRTHNRWLVIWRDHRKNTQASLVDDDVTDTKFPFGVEPEMIDDSCRSIIALVEVGDTSKVPLVAIDDAEYKLGEPSRPTKPLSDLSDLTRAPDYGAACDEVIAENRASDATVSPSWDRVKALLIGHLGIEDAKVTPTARLVEDLDCDSLDIVELVMTFEENFNIEIADDEAEKITTVSEAVFLIDEKRRDG